MPALTEDRALSNSERLMHVSCSIVCYRNRPSQIAKALYSVTHLMSDSIEMSVCFVDNSPNDALSGVADQYGAAYVHLPHNPGFGAAHNIAMRKALEFGTTYHLVLNPDTYFEGSVIPRLVEFMESNPDVGLVMPRIRYPEGQNQHLCKLLPSPADLFLRRFFPAFYRSCGRLEKYELHKSGYDKMMEVPSLSGCFMLIRAAVLRRTGMFDERFFMYLEDVDLSRRIGRVARTVYFPSVSITHEYVKGSYKSRKLLLHHVRSAVLYFNKWGWIWDKERNEVNKRALQKIELLIAEATCASISS